jgi:hypothetical protein
MFGSSMIKDCYNEVKLCSPVGLHVVRSAEQLYLACAGGEPLYDAVDLVRLVACGSHLRHDHVTVQAAVQVRRVAFHPHLTNQKHQS